MNTNKVVNGVIGKGYSPKRLTSDSDGDGVMNVMDCQPNNKRKQGFIHDAYNYAKKQAQRKYKEVKEAPGKYMEEKELEGVQERELQRQAKEKADRVYVEERKKYLENQAVARAKAKAAPVARKGGGGFGNVLASLSGVGVSGSSPSTTPRSMPTRRKVVSYKKVGKGKKAKYKKVISYKGGTQPNKTAQKNPSNISNTLFGNSNITSGELGQMTGVKSKKKNGGGVLSLRL